MFNKVILVGNLSRDIELRYTPSGQAVAYYSKKLDDVWKKEGYKEACRKFATDEEVNAARIAAGTTR